jgi:hypothetical protein
MNPPDNAIFHAYDAADDVGYAGWYQDPSGVMIGFKRLDGTFESMPVKNDGCCCESPICEISSCGAPYEGESMIGRTVTIVYGDQSFQGVVTRRHQRGDRAAILGHQGVGIIRTGRSVPARSVGG